MAIIRELQSETGSYLTAHTTSLRSRSERRPPRRSPSGESGRAAREPQAAQPHSGLLQRDPDPAPVSRKFQAGLEPLKRDSHTLGALNQNIGEIQRPKRRDRLDQDIKGPASVQMAPTDSKLRHRAHAWILRSGCDASSIR
jgi:hypothetical protein